jgi:hypothetical protein
LVCGDNQVVEGKSEERKHGINAGVVVPRQFMDQSAEATMREARVSVGARSEAPMVSTLIYIRDNFTNPSNFTHFCKHPPNIQKLSLTLLELSKILTYPPPYKLGHKFFKKYQNTPVFYF